MGVNNLWSILEPVKRKENLSALSNKTLCVDLSGWICEAQCAKDLKQHIGKPHLRNLFFRFLRLTRLGVKLVFVVDGKPPEVKWNAIHTRQHGRQSWKAKNPGEAVSGARVGLSHFAIWVRECRTLLNLLGVPCIESTGEAEALCAWLDLNQFVDGCITNDGDAFLYGARTVYKDLCISGKDASVECYKIEEIEAKLNLNRQKLVALGILLGCDYLPQGVAGVGKEIAMRLIQNVNHNNLIDRFYEWAKGTDLDENLSSVEKSVKCKALKDKNFPHPEVIQEFLTPKVVPQQVSLKIFNPDLQGLQEFCLKNLEWPEEYTREKVVLLITYWQMTSSLQHYTTTLVQPERIVKARIQQKIECYEVEWQNVQLGETCPASFVTIETKQLFAQVYPELVEEFNDNEAVKLSKKSKKKKAVKLPAMSDDHENEVELLSKQLEDLSVHHSSEQCHSSEAQHEKPLSFFADAISNISNDDSLQDIIDSILPSESNDHSSHRLSLERPSPFTKMDDIRMKFSAADIGGNDNDGDNGYDNDDDEDNGYNDDDGEEDDDVGDDDDDIPWDFEPLQTEVVAANLDHESGSESDDDSQKLKPFKLKGVKTTPDLQDVLECIDTDDCYCHGSEDESSNNNKPIEHPLILLERKELEELKPIPYSGNVKIAKPIDNNGHGKNPKSMQSVKPSKLKAVLNDADLIEIFGSSDEEDNGKSPFMLKQTKLKDGAHDSRLDGFKSRNDIPKDIFYTLDTKYPQRPMQHANVREFSSNNDLKNAASEESCSAIINSKKGCCLSSVVQDVSCAKSSVSSSKVGVKCVNSATAKKKELPRGTRKVLKPANTSQHRTPQSAMKCFKGKSQMTVQYDIVNGISSCGRSDKLEEHESHKENADSPFDDDMPAPLSKRLGKQFSAKQRLASLHSISSVSDL